MSTHFDEASVWFLIFEIITLLLVSSPFLIHQCTLTPGVDFPAVAKEAVNTALQQAGLKEKDLSYIATTGFGRYNVPFRDIQFTESTSVARGAVFIFPKTRCLLDIGAQSTRAMRILDTGKVRNFRTNDKCAAGAGGFICER